MTIYEPVGHQVAQFRATDRDYAENGDVIYQIVHFSVLSSTNAAFALTEGENAEIKPNKTSAAPDGSPFELDSSTGALYIARALSLQDMGLDIIIVTVMIAVAIFIALFLIAAMVFLQCPVCRRRRLGANYDRANCGSNHKSPSPTAGVDLQYSVSPDTHGYYYLPEVFRDSHSLISLVGGGSRPGDTTVGKENSLGSSAYSYDGHDDMSGETLVYPAILQLSEDGQSATILEAPKIPSSAVQSGVRFGDIAASYQKNLSKEPTTPRSKKESIKLLPLSAKLERSQVMFIDKPECSSLNSFRRVTEEPHNSKDLAARIETNEVSNVTSPTHQNQKSVDVTMPSKKQSTISWMEPESSICFLDSDLSVSFELQEGSSNQPANNSLRTESRTDMDAGNGYARLGASESIAYDDLIHGNNDKSELYTDFPNTAPRDAETRTCLFSKMEQDPYSKLQTLTAECRRLKNLKHDYAIVEQPSSSSAINSVQAVTRASSCHSIRAQLKTEFEAQRKYLTVSINGKSVQLQPDTASDITLISKCTWQCTSNRAKSCQIESTGGKADLDSTGEIPLCFASTL
ncbi:unnamed protein product [Dibothriocephalus latus]|uniref:Cadherin domain-containing protein n=1 Tax=Dibothriocephalus latus TaxID=60516 RepID=A0A3P6SRQ0_DIBLA|nr:unnamed protein product [Dibothriocephalus latus]